jgi:hypothetical protein
VYCWLRLLLIYLAAAAAGTIPATPQDAKSAKAFLGDAYSHYAKDGQGISLYGPLAEQYFHSSLIALIQAHDKTLGSNLGELDGDLVCSCMDWGGIFDLKIDIQVENPQRAIAKVSFALYEGNDRNKDSWRRLRITLVPEHGDWRIWDIADYSNPNLVYSVRKEIKDDIEFHAKNSTGNGAKP